MRRFLWAVAALVAASACTEVRPRDVTEVRTVDPPVFEDPPPPRDVQAPSVVASPAPGRHVGPLSVAVWASEPAELFFRRDGQDPAPDDPASERAPGYLEIARATEPFEVRVVARDLAGNVGPVARFSFDVRPPPGRVTGVVTVEPRYRGTGGWVHLLDRPAAEGGQPLRTVRVPPVGAEGAAFVFLGVASGTYHLETRLDWDGDGDDDEGAIGLLAEPVTIALDDPDRATIEGLAVHVADSTSGSLAGWVGLTEAHAGLPTRLFAERLNPWNPSGTPLEVREGRWMGPRESDGLRPFQIPATGQGHWRAAVHLDADRDGTFGASEPLFRQVQPRWVDPVAGPRHDGGALLVADGFEAPAHLPRVSGAVRLGEPVPGHTVHVWLFVPPMTAFHDPRANPWAYGNPTGAWPDLRYASLAIDGNDTDAVVPYLFHPVEERDYRPVAAVVREVAPPDDPIDQVQRWYLYPGDLEAGVIEATGAETLHDVDGTGARIAGTLAESTWVGGPASIHRFVVRLEVPRAGAPTFPFLRGYFRAMFPDADHASVSYAFGGVPDGDYELVCWRDSNGNDWIDNAEPSRRRTVHVEAGVVTIDDPAGADFTW